MAQRTLFDKKSLNELKKHPLYSQDGKGGDTYFTDDYGFKKLSKSAAAGSVG